MLSQHTPTEYHCFCGAKFKQQTSFTKHQKYDCNLLNESIIHQCPDCGVKFSKERNLIRHRKNNCTSKISISSNKRLYSCTFENCDIPFYKLTSLTDHVEYFHNVEITRDSLVFSNYLEFCKWKQKEEQSTFSYFSKRHSAPTSFADSSQKKDPKAIYETYYCQFHGSDKPHHQTKNMKKNKKGRAKTGMVCYAHMFTKIEGDRSVNVKYVSSHTHPLVADNTKFQPLPQILKDEILQLNSIGFSLPEIHKRITRSEVSRENRENPKQGREHFIKVHNIRYLLKSVEKNEKSEIDECSTISNIIDSWSNESYNPVLIYKPQGECISIGPYMDLPQDDFLFGFQTKQQRDFMQIRCHDVLFIDFLYDTEGYGVQILTVALADENKEEYPVAHFLMTSTDEDTLTLCMYALKQKIPSISLKSVMTTDARIFTVIKNVFNEDCQCYFCHSFVLKQWSKKLSESVNNKQIHDEVMLHLEKILNETLEEEFMILCEYFCSKYLKLAPGFINYFKSYYLKPEEIPLWASFCRDVTINTNVIIDKFYDLLKSKYLSRISEKSLDKLIIAFAEVEKDYYIKMREVNYVNNESVNMDEEDEEEMSNEVHETVLGIMENGCCNGVDHENFLKGRTLDDKRQSIKNSLARLSELIQNEDIPESLLDYLECELEKLVNECERVIINKRANYKLNDPIIVELTNVPDSSKNNSTSHSHDHVYCIRETELADHGALEIGEEVVVSEKMDFVYEKSNGY